MESECPKCKSKNITISYWFNPQKKGYERELKCRECNFKMVG